MRRALLCALLLAASVMGLRPAADAPQATAAAVRETGAPRVERPVPPTSRPDAGPLARSTSGPVATSVEPLGTFEPTPSRPQRAPQPHSFREYVALGDSWSADVVIADLYGLPDDTHAPVDCAQSRVNYPKLVAKALGVPTFRDATYSQS